MEYTTNQKGLITELEVALYFIKLGYSVSQPLNIDSKYDFILDTGKQLLKIQVKTAHNPTDKNDTIRFKCRSVTGRNQVKQSLYSKEDIDYFATFWEGEVYLIPVEECSTEKTLRLNRDIVRSNWNYAEDYLATEVLKVL